jgi:hypothetical protein
MRVPFLFHFCPSYPAIFFTGWKIRTLVHSIAFDAACIDATARVHAFAGIREAFAA